MASSPGFNCRRLGGDILDVYHYSAYSPATSSNSSIASYSPHTPSPALLPDTPLPLVVVSSTSVLREGCPDDSYCRATTTSIIFRTLRVLIRRVLCTPMAIILHLGYMGSALRPLRASSAAQNSPMHSKRGRISWRARNSRSCAVPSFSTLSTRFLLPRHLPLAFRLR